MQSFSCAVPGICSHLFRQNGHKPFLKFYTIHHSRLPDSPLCEKDVLVRHGRLAHQNSVAPCLAGGCQLALTCTCAVRFSEMGLCTPAQRLVRTLFCRRSLPVTSRSTTPCGVSTEPNMLSLVNFSRKRSSSDSHIARQQTPFITRFAFSILPSLWCLLVHVAPVSVSFVCSGLPSMAAPVSDPSATDPRCAPEPRRTQRVVPTRYSRRLSLGAALPTVSQIRHRRKW